MELASWPPLSMLALHGMMFPCELIVERLVNSGDKNYAKNIFICMYCPQKLKIFI